MNEFTWRMALGICALASVAGCTSSEPVDASATTPDGGVSCDWNTRPDLGLPACTDSGGASLVFMLPRVQLPANLTSLSGPPHNPDPTTAIWVGTREGATPSSSIIDLEVDGVASPIEVQLTMADLPSVSSGTMVSLRSTEVGLEFTRAADSVTLLRVGDFEGDLADYPDLSLAGLELTPEPACQSYDALDVCILAFERSALVAQADGEPVRIEPGERGRVTRGAHSFEIINRVLAHRVLDYPGRSGCSECAVLIYPTLAVDVVLVEDPTP